MDKFLLYNLRNNSTNSIKLKKFIQIIVNFLILLKIKITNIQNYNKMNIFVK